VTFSVEKRGVVIHIRFVQVTLTSTLNKKLLVSDLTFQREFF